MRVIAVKTLREFWEQPQYADSEQSLKAWNQEVRKANWASPTDIKAVFRQASIIAGNRVVFNIAGNKYRLVVKIHYNLRIIYIRFIGTHAQYDQIDVEKV
jgi:mRNA interferase HigB